VAVFDSFRRPEIARGQLMVAGEVAQRRPAYDGAVVTVKCDEAGVESCGAGFAFSGSAGPDDRLRLRHAQFLHLL